MQAIAVERGGVVPCPGAWTTPHGHERAALSCHYRAVFLPTVQPSGCWFRLGTGPPFRGKTGPRLGCVPVPPVAV